MTKIEKLRFILERKEELYKSTMEFYENNGDEDKARRYQALWSEVYGVLLAINSDEHLNDIYAMWADDAE